MTVGNNIFTHQMPSANQTIICLYQYGGEPMDLVDDYEFPQLQVKARAITALAALQKLDDVREALHTLSEEIINGTRYLYISASSSPAYLGTQKLDSGYLMHQFTMNFSVIKEVG
jgi:hypothetical protein